jgi:hypothetical protein
MTVASPQNREAEQPVLGAALARLIEQDLRPEDF